MKVKLKFTVKAYQRLLFLNTKDKAKLKKK